MERNKQHEIKEGKNKDACKDATKETWKAYEEKERKKKGWWWKV